MTYQSSRHSSLAKYDSFSISNSQFADFPHQRFRRPRRTSTLFLAWSGLFALAALLIGSDWQSKSSDVGKVDHCQQHVQTQSFLSRESLAEIPTIPTGATKAAVRGVLSEPYCIMAPKNYQSDEMAHREAYPLEFDPHTWVIILYENDEYAGYEFSFRR